MIHYNLIMYGLTESFGSIACIPYNKSLITKYLPNVGTLRI